MLKVGKITNWKLKSLIWHAVAHLVFVLLHLTILGHGIINAAACSTRTEEQICVNCKASSNCGNYSLATLTNKDAPHCSQPCTALPVATCSLAQVETNSNTCVLYGPCVQVTFATGYTTMRRTCVSDCIAYEVTSYPTMMGVCNPLAANVGYSTNTENGCLSACLDTVGCRGVTVSHGSGTCTLHSCDLRTFRDDFSFIGITCKQTTTTSTTTVITTTSLTTSSILPSTTTSAAVTSTIPTTTSSSSVTSTAPPATMTQLKSSTATSAVPTLRTSVEAFSATDLALQSSTTETSTQDMTSNPASSTVLIYSSLLHSITIPLKEETLVEKGFLDEPANIAVLSSVGGAMILAGASAAICLMVPKKRS